MRYVRMLQAGRRAQGADVVGEMRREQDCLSCMQQETPECGRCRLQAKSTRTGNCDSRECSWELGVAVAPAPAAAEAAAMAGCMLTAAGR